MMTTTKRSFSPTIDDIRQYSIKRQRLLSDLENLTLTSQPSADSMNIDSQSSHTPQSTKYKEYITDIDDFLLQNQDDQDILESSRHLLDLESADIQNLIIPNSVTRVPLSNENAKFSFDRVEGRKKFEYKYNKFNHDSPRIITNDEILYDYEVLRYWSLMKYIRDPLHIVYKVWERWYFNVYKLEEMSRGLNSDRIEMLPDDYTGRVDITNGGDVIDEDDDLMIDDEGFGISCEVKQLSDGVNHYGGYYGNSSLDVSQEQSNDEMEID